MGEKWESDSLRWIHEVREENYKQIQGKPLGKFPLGPSRAAHTLARRLGLKRVPFRPAERLTPRKQTR